MQKIVLKFIVGLLVVGVLGMGLIAVALPPFINSDEFYTTLRDGVSDTLGTPVEWESLEVGFFPLRLKVEEPVLLAATGNPEEARLTAESVYLRLERLPLLLGRIEVESVALTGVEFVVTRTPDGFILPVSTEETDSTESDGEELAAVEADVATESVDFQIRRIMISDSRILLRDETSSPPVEWRLEKFEFEANAGREAGALVVALSADLHSNSTRLFQIRSRGDVTLAGEVDLEIEIEDGTRVDVEGNATLAGGLDLRAKIESFDLALVGLFLPSPTMELAGRATGDGSWVGEASSPDVIRLDLAVTAGLLRTPDYLVEGPFLVRVEAKNPLSEHPRGRVELDLTTAQLEYEEQFKKPAGMRAELTADFETDEAGALEYESSIKFRDVNEILLQGAIGESTSIALTASKIDLDRLSDVLPALAPFNFDGMISFDAFGVGARDGTRQGFGGRIDLQGAGFSLPGRDRIEIQGAIHGEGNRIRAEDVRLRTGTVAVDIDGTVEDPLNAARFDFSVKSIGSAEVNDLLSAFTSNSDTLFGPLSFEGEFRGAASSEADLYRSVVGSLEFSVGKGEGGRLRGVSILKVILDEIPLLGGAGLLTQPFRSGRSVDDYFTDHFEILEGKFELAQGHVAAKPLRIVYEGYEATLTGPIRLRDLEIDMSGEVLLKDDLVSSLGGLTGAEAPDREPIRIPLARVTNTLLDPKIELTPEILVAVPKLLLQGTGLDTVVIGVGKSLGRLFRKSDK